MALRARDEEDPSIEDDSPTTKKQNSSFPVSRYEVIRAFGVFVFCSVGLFSVYSTMPKSEFYDITVPRTIHDLRKLKDHVGKYAEAYPGKFILGWSIILLFSVQVIWEAYYYLVVARKVEILPGRAKRRKKLLNYMLFLSITPTLPNLFINLASPIVDIPFHVFFLATLVGLVPASFITVKAGLALGDLKSVKDLYDYKTLSILFLIGFLSILPTILKRKRIYE